MPRWFLVGIAIVYSLNSGCWKDSPAEQHAPVEEAFLSKVPIAQEPAIPLDSIRDSSSVHFSFRSRGGAAIRPFALMAEGQFARLESFFAKTPKQVKLPAFTVQLYPSVEAKGLLSRNTRVSHIGERGDIHRIAHRAFREHEDEMLAVRMIRKTLPPPKHRMLETGLGVYCTTHWRGKGYRYWASRLIHSGNAMPLKELLDNDLFQKESDLVTSCLSGVWVAFLVEKWGETAFLNQYNTFSPNKKQIAQLETEFNAWAVGSLPKFTRPGRKAIPVGLRGFNFTHEGYNIDNGYSGDMAACSLDTLCNTGANAVALVPYSYMRNPQAPSFFPFMRNHPGTETDEGVIHCMFQAQKRLMFCMLKPQVWLGGGSWPGDVQMQSEADWQAFFAYYHRWVRHYALLAAMYEADAFCVGVEFAKATQERPEDWRVLIAKVRGIFPGIVTYAANWGEEFQALAFADALDVVGLNCYYPLGTSDSMSQAQLQAAFEDRLVYIGEQSARWNRPVWLTELGYPSLAMPWKQPHAEPRGLPSKPEHQARCYTATLLAIEKAGWPVSQFWWKWPTNPDESKLEDKDFKPVAKPAQAVIRRMWSKKR